MKLSYLYVIPLPVKHCKLIHIRPSIIEKLHNQAQQPTILPIPLSLLK